MSFKIKSGGNRWSYRRDGQYVASQLHLIYHPQYYENYDDYNDQRDKRIEHTSPIVLDTV